MKGSIATATFLLVGASATAVWAPYTGDNIAANGSDTLFEVTQTVLTLCPSKFADFGTHNITYLGGGSTTGAGAMIGNLQQVAPMSRGLRNTEYCTIAPIDFDGDGPETARSPVDTTTALLVGLDGMAAVANAANSCGPNGLATAGSFPITDMTGTPGSCPGCELVGGVQSYVIGSAATSTAGLPNVAAFDVLRLVYGGLHHDGTFDCNSNVRRSLIKNWGVLFSGACPAGVTACPNGITHAWRRSDLSGTTDTFVSLVGFTVQLNPGMTPAINDARAIGSHPLATASPAQNPFCNSIDANLAKVPCGIGGVTCPVGSTCSAPTSQPPTGRCLMPAGAPLCGLGNPCAAGFECTLPLSNPPTGQCYARSAAPAFPVCGANVPCPSGFTCDDATSNPAAGHCAGQVCGTGAACPTGWSCSLPTSSPPGGVCWRSLGGRSDFSDMDPIRVPCGNTPDQISCNPNGQVGFVLPVLLPDTTAVTLSDAYPVDTCSAGLCELEAPAASTTVTLQRVICPDGNLPFANRCFQPYRLNPDSTRNYQCRSGRVTNRCFGIAANGNDGRAYNKPLINASATRPSDYATDNLGRVMTASWFRYRQNPTLPAPCNTEADDSSQIGCLTNADACSLGFAGRIAAPPGSNKALAVNAIFPTDANVRNLLTGTPPIYPLARRLFFNTLRGFNNLVGGESEFAKCYGDNTIMRTAMLDSAFTPLAAPGIQCLDYDSTAATTASPLAGCGAVGPNNNACVSNPPQIAPYLNCPAAPTSVAQCDGVAEGTPGTCAPGQLCFVVTGTGCSCL